VRRSTMSRSIHPDFWRKAGDSKVREIARCYGRVSRCRICGSLELAPKFRVAFPDFGPNASHAWPIGLEPPVPYWNIYGCGRCGVHFPNPMPTADEVYEYYANQQDYDEWEEAFYVADTPDRQHYWSRFAEKLTRLNGGSGRLLEIGPAAGHLLHAAREQGWSVVGIEAAPKFGKILRRRGIPTHQGLLETFSCKGQFDLIVMLDVLEHLNDPIGDLERCRRLLTSNGRVVIATCDIGSVAARYYGLKWRQLVISHTFYWTKASIQVALGRAEFDLVQLSSVRWWDPERPLERRQHRKEFGKLLVRKAVQLTWLPVTRRSRLAHTFQSTFRDGRLDYWMTHKLGDQTVMSDVVLAVARSRGFAAGADLPDHRASPKV